MAIKSIEVTDYPDKYDDGEYTLVDVRETDEYAAGRLPGTVNIPLSELKQRRDEIPTDKPVLIVCKTGGRSLMAAQLLEATGQYGELVNLDGGTKGWADAGNDIET